ncbi:hypothetical protein SLA2020_474800 [Shorea laevis]
MASLSTLSLLLLLIFTFADQCDSQNTTSTECLKLPLLHKKPFVSPAEALSWDYNRLTALHNRGTPKSPVVSGAPSGSGQYFVSLRLGTPPQTLLLVADTGSDLVWVKCSACNTDCSSATHVPGSAFFARHSSTFSPHHCFDSPCQLVPHPPRSRCNHTSRLHTPCRYQYSYADGSFTSGFFSKETTTLNTSAGREASLKSLAFGCGFRVSGPSVSGASFNGAHGVMGLGRGPISFSSQLGRRFGNKFSYCLMDYTISPPPTSFLTIGHNRRFKRRVRRLPSLAVAEPTLGFDLCVNVSGVSRPSLPRLRFRLIGNSVFSPPPRNYFIETAEQVMCLAIQPVNSETGFSVIGNLMQQGFLLEFDRERSRLGFSRHGCALP